MMPRTLGLSAAIGMALTTPLLAQGKPDDDPHVDAMFAAIRSGQPQKAIDEANAVIARNAARYNKAGTLYFCAGSQAETLESMMLAMAARKNAVAISYDWCDALFVKGFALVDLHRLDLAEPELRRATELAPFNAHYLNEYAELFKTRHEWRKSYELFEKAYGLTGREDGNKSNAIAARSLRGMGFTKIEMGSLDEAEALFRRSLELEPGNAAAQAELQYIASKRASGQ